MSSTFEIKHLERAIEIALNAEMLGNLPVGAVLELDNQVIAEAGSAIIVPHYHPGRHAEVEVLRNVSPDVWPLSRRVTCYTTLEPCLMCFGALLLHGIGRVVFGALDPEGGASSILPHLPRYYSTGTAVPEWIGPVMSEKCDPLYCRAKEIFNRLPCGGLATQ